MSLLNQNINVFYKKNLTNPKVVHVNKFCTNFSVFFFLLVCAVNNVVYELFNRKLHEGAFGLAVIVCQELCKDCPPSLPVDRVRTTVPSGHLLTLFGISNK